jgi:hypothetical protein
MLDYTPTLDMFEKLECALALHNSKHPATNGYFIQILKDYANADPKTRPSSTMFIDVLRYLLTESNVVDAVKTYITWLFNKSGLPVQFVYRTIASIQRDEERMASKAYLDCLYTEFFQSSTVDDNHRILSAQYLLQNKLLTSEVEQTILAIAQDTKKEYNTRADAADLLMKLGGEQCHVEASKIITELGRDISRAPTFASNRQNVHAVDESVKAFLLMLAGMKLDIVKETGLPDRVRTFDDILETIKTLNKYSTDPESQDKVNSSLLRIKLDQLVYPGCQSLTTIFIKIFQMIEKHAYKDMLLDRLIEELIDMADTCSTGHCNRLVNVFSGIDGFTLDIGWKNQIESNIAARLTVYARSAINTEARRKPDPKETRTIQEIDEDYRAKILCEMTSSELSERLTFHQFFREHVSRLHDELYREFVGDAYVSEDDFELYFRQGIMFYDTGRREEFK